MNASLIRPEVAASTLQKCIAAAVRAPSGDNTQPWRFECDVPAGRISVFLNEASDPSPMNCGQTMSRIACGAAVENILIQAAAEGCTATVEAGSGNCVATVHLEQADSPSFVLRRRSDTLYARVTNRRRYDGRAVSPSLLTVIAKSTPLLDGTHTQWCADRSRIDALARIIGEADGIMFGERAIRNAFLSNIRFDRPAQEEVDSGLPVASLELSPPNRLAMRVLHRVPSGVLNVSGATRLFNRHARKLVASSSGICVISTPDVDRPDYARAGRAVQRAWLTLTELGFAVQPMMSLMVLLNALNHGSPHLAAALGRERVDKLLRRFHEVLPEISQFKPLYLMRFGYAPAPSGRTGRRLQE